ncbi:helix-turn-helix domain-containing protein [Breoghania sp.]|uniref:MarR family transcriptional regulator n=1 Tax=Breoghania sp. TaxID=2065378 RepID=UPI0026382429|nr:helix-turn-helix domain-containing protein [Breoghania sp.]
MPQQRPVALSGRPRVDEKTLAEARVLFETQAEISQAEICRRLGMSTGTLAYHARCEGWVRAEGVLVYRQGVARDKREKLVAQLYRAFERQVGELEDLSEPS